jgi:hypothetical protein
MVPVVVIPQIYRSFIVVVVALFVVVVIVNADRSSGYQ